MNKKFAEIETPKGHHLVNATLRLGIEAKSFKDCKTEEQLIEAIKEIFCYEFGAGDQDFTSIEIPDAFIEEWKKLLSPEIELKEAIERVDSIYNS